MVCDGSRCLRAVGLLVKQLGVRPVRSSDRRPTRMVQEAALNFTATLELNGKTATGIEVPASVLEALGGGKRPAVSVTLGAHTYRTTVGSMGGRAMLPLSAEVRAAGGVSAGEVLEVTLVLDDVPRAVEVPADLQAALDADPAAQQAFTALSYSNQRRHGLAVEGAKAADTRARRVAKVLGELRG